MSVGKLVSAATLGVLVAFGTAQGADLYGGYGGYKDEPPVRAFTWQGFYLGAYWGWAWSSIDAANNAVLLTNQGSMPFGSPSSSGLLGGAEFGYNVQSGNFVYGIEVDLGGLDTGASGSYTDPNNTNRTIFVKSAGGFYGDITGRLGLTFGNALIYAKGGRCPRRHQSRQRNLHRLDYWRWGRISAHSQFVAQSRVSVFGSRQRKLQLLLFIIWTSR